MIPFFATSIVLFRQYSFRNYFLLSLIAVLFTLGCSDALFYAFVDDDRDGDGIYDLKDNCLNTANPEQKDTDGDSIGDACDDKNDNGEVVKLNLSVDPSINGTITSIPEGIDCGSKGITCKAEFSKGTEVTLTAKADTGYVPGAWQGNCDKTDADQPCKLTMNANQTAGRVFLLDTDEDGDPDITDSDDDGDGTDDVTDVDDDNDGLIEVHNLDMFDHIQHNLDGTSYKDSGSAADNWTGAPTATTADCTTDVDGDGFFLCGYELTTDLDFAEGASYAGGSVNTDWRPDDEDTSVATNAGFTGPNNFAGIFEGNGYKISNLYSRGSGSKGLFKITISTSSIRNLEVVDAHLYGGVGDDLIGGLVGWNQGSISASSATGGTVNGGDGIDEVGGLVGYNDKGDIVASYATGAVNGDAGDDTVGGLVGYNDEGSILASYATGAVNGGVGDDEVGGLVGYTNRGNISASYATGAANGGAGGDRVGGLVGVMGTGTNTITASYATGAVNGGDGADYVGGLVGYMVAGTNTITASYATGAVNGGAKSDYVGGLVGYMFNGINSIIASYATGAANGGAKSDYVGALVGYVGSGNNSITASYATGDANGDGGSDNVGALVGEVNTSGTNTITHSYAFGNAINGRDNGDGDPPTGVTSATNLTAMNAGVSWNDVTQRTLGAWDFGTTSQAPALKYADYDGSGGTDYCDLFPDKIPGTDTTLVCGTSLLPGQRK